MFLLPGGQTVGLSQFYMHLIAMTLRYAPSKHTRVPQVCLWKAKSLALGSILPRSQSSKLVAWSNISSRLWIIVALLCLLAREFYGMSLELHVCMLPQSNRFWWLRCCAGLVAADRPIRRTGLRMKSALPLIACWCVRRMQLFSQNCHVRRQSLTPACQRIHAICLVWHGNARNTSRLNCLIV